MAIPDRKNNFWRDAAGSIPTQPEQLGYSGPTVVVPASMMFPAIPDGGPAIIQNEQVGCCRKSKNIYV